MLTLVIIGCMWGALQAQYSQDGYQQPRPQQQSYVPRPQQQSYVPAPVHYVNIGAELKGDYKFGYDTGKGPAGHSFREETRLPDGSVQGAYGYVDASGKQRIVKYTAGASGFVAEGDVGPSGAPKATAPGPAPQPAAQPVASQGYLPQQPRQYGPPADTQSYQSNAVSNGGQYYR